MSNTVQHKNFGLQGIHIMAKPIGPRCNLDCDYCFYLEKQALFPDEENYWMSDEVLASYVSKYIDIQKAPFVEFVCQSLEGVQLPYLTQLTQYELLTYHCRYEYLYHWKPLESIDGNPVRTCVLIEPFDYNIPKLIDALHHENPLNVGVEKKQIQVLAYPIFSETIHLMTINDTVKNIITLCDGTRSIAEVTREMADKLNVPDKEKFALQMDGLFNQFKEKRLLL